MVLLSLKTAIRIMGKKESLNHAVKEDCRLTTNLLVGDYQLSISKGKA